MHHFKRFYLIGSIVAAIVIPLITFTVYVEPITSLEALSVGSVENTIARAQEPQISQIEKSNYIPIITWSFYALGILFFFIRFSKNLLEIIQKIRRNPKYKQQHFIHVLLKEVMVPHTFFKYVFVNKDKFEENDIPDEVLLHEQAHATQKHSLDVILVELYQVVFWFNPLVYILKKDMKLNHEFMADAAVIALGADQKSYQNILLQYSSNDETCELTHAFNYSSIKKRLTVMKTQTSKTSKWIRSFLLLPLLAFMVYGFSSKKEKIKEVEPLAEINAIADNDYTARSLTINILKDGTYVIDDEVTANKSTLADVVHQFHQDITAETRNRIMNIHVTSASNVSEKETWFLYESLFDYGFHRMVTPNEEIIKSKGNTPQRTKNYAEQYLEGASRNGKKAFVLEIYDNSIRFNNKPVTLEKLSNTIDDYTKNWEETDYTNAYPSIITKGTSESFLKKVNKEFTKTHYSKANEGMTLQSKSTGLASETVTKEQKGASREQMNTYNKLATHYNNMLSKKGNIKIKMKDVEKLKYIYGLMSKKQRADAEPFPDFPEPPPAPDTPNPPKALSFEGEIDAPPAPPTPEAPQSPLDHVVDMAKKGAIFYLEGKQISSDEAVAVLKKNNSLNIETKQTNSKSPKVYISKKPIVVEKRKASPKTKASPKATKKVKERVKSSPKTAINLTEAISKGATFYLNGKEISPQLAQESVKSNKTINIKTEDMDSANPKVYISVD